MSSVLHQLDNRRISQQLASRQRRRTGRLAALLLLVAATAATGGILLRAQVWRATVPLRQSQDVSNGWGWGQRALTHGPRGLYAHVISTHPRGNFDLDYPPLRLLVVTVWARWTNYAYPHSPQWRSDDGFNAPMLAFNALMELLTAIGVFLIVKHWAARCDASLAPRSSLGRWLWRMRWRLLGRKLTNSSIPVEGAMTAPLQGSCRGLMAAMLAWFNPAMLLDAHAWPQWDVWALPFYVFAVYAAIRNRWLVAGTLIAIGAMFKGQLLLVAPLLALWPLFARRPGDLAKFFLGLLLGISIGAGWWLVGQGMLWLAGVVLAIVVLKGTRGGRPASAWITVPVAAELILWPLILPGQRSVTPFLALTSFTTAIIAIGLAKKLRLSHGLILASAGSLFLCPLLFGGSWDWLRVGYLYGSGKHPELSISAENLPALLERCGLTSTARLTLVDLAGTGVHIALSLRALLGTTYALTLLLAAWMMARHHERRDPRLLLAAVLPWVTCFALLPQMFERYLVWGACLGALWVLSGLRLVALHLLITALSAAMMLQTMLAGRTAAWPALERDVSWSRPAWSWMILGAAALLMYLALPGPVVREAEHGCDGSIAGGAEPLAG